MDGLFYLARVLGGWDPEFITLITAIGYCLIVTSNFFVHMALLFKS